MYNIIRGRSGTDTNFYYDDWGRMISKDQGSYDATYEYRYGDKLYSVTSDFPGEGNVTYDYGSDGKRRTRETATSYMWYNWAGRNVINEEDSGNFLERTYIHDPGKVVGTIMAHSQGTNPSTGTWRYYLQDNIGSTRNLTDDSKVEKGRYWYYPYGDIYSQSGEAIRYMFTGKEWDDDAQMYYFPFRYYSPGSARWMTRDPIGIAAGLNLYGYVGSNPVNYFDPLGLQEEGWPINPYMLTMTDCDALGLAQDLFTGGMEQAPFIFGYLGLTVISVLAESPQPAFVIGFLGHLGLWLLPAFGQNVSFEALFDASEYDWVSRGLRRRLRERPYEGWPWYIPLPEEEGVAPNTHVCPECGELVVNPPWVR